MSFLDKIPSLKYAGQFVDSKNPGGNKRTGSGGQRFLDPKTLARISSLQLVARTVVDGFLTGLHRSPFPGVSVEFAEYRSYSPGDDPRSIDWNVYARSDRYYQKQYQGETNSEFHILLDASASMGYRTPEVDPEALTKFQYACFLAASLSYFSIQQRDATGLLLFDTEIRESIPARMRTGQLSRILHILDKASPGQRTDLASTLWTVGSFLRRRRGVVVLISDFYEQPEHILAALRALQFGGNDLILFHLLDPIELEFDMRLPVQLEDMETNELLEVIPDKAGPGYRKLVQDHIATLGQECRSARIDYQVLDTSKPIDFALFSYLLARQRRI
jgi:uncharacterized protein (DUF58 family)